MSSNVTSVDQFSPLTDPVQHGSSSQPVQAIEGFITSVRHLASMEGFREVESLIAEVSSLKKDLKARTTKVNDLQEEHKRTYHTMLETHQESVTRVNKEKNDLQQKHSTITEELEDEKKNHTKTQKLKHDLEQQSMIYSTQYNEEREKVVKAGNEILALKLRLDGKDRQIKENNEKIKTQQKTIADQQSNLETSEREKQLLYGQLENIKTKLRRIKGFTKDLIDNDFGEDSNHLQESWQLCLKAVKSCFEKDLSDSVLRDPGAWRWLKEANEATHLIALPPSNSQDAKRMRIFLVLAIAAGSLTRHIFTITYLLEDESELRQTLLQLAENNSAQEAFCRAVLLSASGAEQPRVIKDRVSKVVREVLQRVEDLLVPSAIENFRSELQPAIETAAMTWSKIQIRRSRYEADVKADSHDDWKWKAIKFNNDNIVIGSSDILDTDFAKDGPALVVFPRVYAVDEKNDTPIFPGVVLQKSQTVAAHRELEQIETSSPLSGRPMSARATRPRRTTFTRNDQNDIQNEASGSFLV